MKQHRRILPLALALAITMCLLPTSALAAMAACQMPPAPPTPKSENLKTVNKQKPAEICI